MTNLNPAIEATRLSNGELPRFSSVGSYPILYLTSESDCFCAGCVDNLDPELDDASGITAHVNWETPTHCDECSEVIEAAYAEEATVDSDGVILGCEGADCGD